MKVTIRTVAEKAGVSAATVSRVLNRPELVDADTKDRVRAAMDALNFHPSAIARGLSAQATNTVGLVIPGIDDLFFTEFYGGIEQASREQGMKVLLFDAQQSRSRALEGFTFLHQHRVEGIIFTSKVVDEDYEPVLQRIGIPVVLALTESRGRMNLPAFKVDEVRSVFDVVGYLASRGHTRIGMIGGQQMDDITGELRHEGYRKGMEHYGIGYHAEWVEYGNYRFDSGYAAMQRLLSRQGKQRLTAICTASDEMAIGAMRCLYDNGLRVPDDISIVGFDDLRAARMVIPALTTVAQPFSEIGKQAVTTLLRMVQHPEEARPSGVYFLPHRIVERESVRTRNRTD